MLFYSMRNQKSSKKVQFKFREVKSITSSKLSPEQISAFKAKNMKPKDHSSHNFIRCRSKTIFSDQPDSRQRKDEPTNSKTASEKNDQKVIDGKDKMVKILGQKNNVLEKISKKLTTDGNHILELLTLISEAITAKQEIQNKSEKINQNYERKCQNNLKINQVFSEVIKNSISEQEEKNKKKGKQKKKICFEDIPPKNKEQTPRNWKLPSGLAKILIEAFGDSHKRNQPTKNNYQQLKNLISLRFFASNQTYSSFIENLLSFQGEIKNEEFQAILLQKPWLLNYSQIQKIFDIVAEQKKQVAFFRVEKLAQKMRLFVRDEPVMFQRAHKICIAEQQFIKKKESMIKNINKQLLEGCFVDSQTIISTLKEFRFEEFEIKIILAYGSLTISSLEQINHHKFFNEIRFNTL